MEKIRNTKSVTIVLSAFTDAHKALSAVELVKRFNQEMNKTTVYRILERLEREGILHSFSGVNGLKWYAKSEIPLRANGSNDHSHFQCDQCGKSECLTIDFNIPQLPNYRIDSANLVLTGACEHCL